jgi:hypothetical protein
MRKPDDEMVLVLKELLRNANVPIGQFMVGKIGCAERYGTLVLPGCLKMFALQGAIDGIFPLRTAALGANFASDAGT